MCIRRTTITALSIVLTIVYLIAPSTFSPRSTLAQDAPATPTPVDFSRSMR